MTFDELRQRVLEKLPGLLPAFVVEKLGGRAVVANLLDKQEQSLANILVYTTLTATFEELKGTQSIAESEIIEQLAQLAKECPGSENMTPVKAAAQAYKNAIHV